MLCAFLWQFATLITGAAAAVFINPYFILLVMCGVLQFALPYLIYYRKNMHLFQQLQLWAAFIVVIFPLCISKKRLPRLR
jgi:hypothetical protein